MVCPTEVAHLVPEFYEIWTRSLRELPHTLERVHAFAGLAAVVALDATFLVKPKNSRLFIGVSSVFSVAHS